MGQIAVRGPWLALLLGCGLVLCFCASPAAAAPQRSNEGHESRHVQVAAGHAPTGTFYRLLASAYLRRHHAPLLILQLRLRKPSLGLTGGGKAIEPLTVHNSTLELAAGEVTTPRGGSGPFLLGDLRVPGRYVRARWADGSELTMPVKLLPRAWGHHRAFVIPPNAASKLPISLEALDPTGATIGEPFSLAGEFWWLPQ